MAAQVSARLRRLIAERAVSRCEYCLLPQAFAAYSFEPDHIVPLQHGGETNAENLAFACMPCNRYKGPNMGSLDPQTGVLVAFFDPRNQHWDEHFALEGALIRPLTPEGRVTLKIFRFNDEERLQERRALSECGGFDSPPGRAGI